jgi:toxin-antitoxin system PIN domain toxin
MTHLLDVNTLIALIWPSHVHHSKAKAWRIGKSLALCPISELGFIRISTNPTGQFNSSMPDARQALQDFIREEKPQFIPCDAHGLDGTAAPSSAKSTDWYLANLAAKYNARLATLDASLSHQAAEVIL